MDNKEQWDQFIKENRGSFLQSWSWGQLQESMDRKIWRIETDGLKGLVIKHNISLGKNYLYCPRGPIGQGDIKNFITQVKEIAHQEGSIFFKIEPSNDLPLKSFNFIESKKKIQHNQTIILNLNQSKEELLKQMHSKTRYNIRLAEKKGIIIKQSNSQEALDSFLKLSIETAKRDKFFLHPKNYYQKMLDILGQKEKIKIFLAKHEDKIIAANLICFFNQTAIYLHGASDYNHRQLMAPYLLQWQTILTVKEDGFKYYDFWGIDEKKWPGITRFKKGFNGQEVSYPGAYDLIFSKFWYMVYKLGRKVL